MKKTGTGGIRAPVVSVVGRTARDTRRNLASDSFPHADRGFLDLELSLIDEDPHQPRTASNPGYSQEGIEELGLTIRNRGVKSPISVREHPEVAGRYLINHGARRYRASKWAGKTTIPAFIDNDYSETDQVIENLQRENLTAREIADFIGRELARGKRAVDIAQAIGKSKAFVSQHTALLDLPDRIADVFNEGRVRDVTTVNELLRAYRKSPQDVIEWLRDPDQLITRETVTDLREFIDDKLERDSRATAESKGRRKKQPSGASKRSHEAGEKNLHEQRPFGEGVVPGAVRLRRSLVVVRHQGRRALLLMKRPTAEGRAWLRYDDDANEVDANLKDVELIALLED